MMRLPLLIAGCILIYACNSNHDRYAPAYRAFDGIDVIRIAIDKKDVVNLYPDAFETISIPGGPDFYGGYGHHMVVLANTLFLVSNDRKSIILYDLVKEEVPDSYSFEGRGPGEYVNIDFLLTDGNDLFILDRSSFKLVQYDKYFNHIDDHRLDDVTQHFGGVVVHNNYVVYTIETDERYLLRRKLLNEEVSSDYSFHQRTISLGKQPRAYNHLRLKINNTGKLAALSHRMPLVFLYEEDMQPEVILRLSGEHIEKYDTAPASDPPLFDDGTILINPPPVDIEKNKTVRLDAFSFFDAVYSEYKLYLYFSNRYAQERYLIVLENKSGKWIHSGNYRFKKDEQDLFTVFYLAFDDPWLYLGSPFEEDIIRVNVNNLPAN